MSGEICDICGGKSVGVVSSALGAISYATCLECDQLGVEPWPILIGGLVIMGRANVESWVQEMIEATCARVGRTEAELWEAVERMGREYNSHCEDGRRRSILPEPD